eukprot:179071_1
MAEERKQALNEHGNNLNELYTEQASGHYNEHKTKKDVEKLYDMVDDYQEGDGWQGREFAVCVVWRKVLWDLKNGKGFTSQLSGYSYGFGNPALNSILTHVESRLEGKKKILCRPEAYELVYHTYIANLKKEIEFLKSIRKKLNKEQESFCKNQLEDAVTQLIFGSGGCPMM